MVQLCLGTALLLLLQVLLWQQQQAAACPAAAAVMQLLLPAATAQQQQHLRVTAAVQGAVCLALLQHCLGSQQPTKATTDCWPEAAA
jgi:hypothetical protein